MRERRTPTTIRLVDDGRLLSGGAHAVFRNARALARRHPSLFSDDADAMPIYFRNTVPTRDLLSGRFAYMPQNGWPWDGLVAGARERLRRVHLLSQSELAMARTAVAIRTGPTVPQRRRAAHGIHTNPLDDGFEEALARVPEASDVGLPPGALLSVGSAWGYRRFPVLLAGYEAYRRAGGTRPLALVTWGPLVEATRAAAGPGVVLVDQHLDRHDVLGLIDRCHATVFPSSVEASPLTILEAAALGARIVATDIPGHVHALGAMEVSGQVVSDVEAVEGLAEALAAVDSDDTPPVETPLGTAAGRLGLRDRWCDGMAAAIEEALR